MRRDKLPALVTIAVVAVLGIVALLLTLTGGDDGEQTRRIETPPTRESTTTSSTFAPPTTVPTLPTVITVPPTAAPPPTLSPGTIAVVPGPAPAPSAGPAPSTGPAPTPAPGPSTTTPTTTTKPPTVAEELSSFLETALAGGTAPAPGAERGVEVGQLPANDDQGVPTRLRVSWPLDETLTGEDLRIAARVEAATILQVIQGYDRSDDERIILRATLPDADGFPDVVVRLVFERATLEAIDFATIDELTIFELADEADVDPILLPTPTTTTTSTTTTTT